MTKIAAIILALTCATLHAQSVIVKATGAGDVHRAGTGAENVRGVATITITTNTYSGGRFEITSDNKAVVLDNDSGKTWTRNANIDGTKDWTNAISYGSNLTYATYSDWRCPDSVDWILFAENGLPAGHPFTNVQASYYWTSDENAFEPLAWGDMYYPISGGFPAPGLKVDLYYVWPCRGP